MVSPGKYCFNLNIVIFLYILWISPETLWQGFLVLNTCEKDAHSHLNLSGFVSCKMLVGIFPGACWQGGKGDFVWVCKGQTDFIRIYRYIQEGDGFCLGGVVSMIKGLS